MKIYQNDRLSIALLPFLTHNINLQTYKLVQIAELQA